MDKSPKNIGIIIGAFLMGLLVAALFLIITAPRFFPHSWEGKPPAFSSFMQKSLTSVVSISVKTTTPEMPSAEPKRAPYKKSFGDGEQKASRKELRRDFENGSPDRISSRLDVERQRLKIIGSGLIISEDGKILTNCHVLEQVSEPIVTTYSGEQFVGRLMGKDPDTDLALIKIDAKHPLPSAVWGDSDGVQVGDWVIAIGSPLGFEQSCSVGIISAKNRVLGMGLYDDFLQTDAFMHIGSSGGPLLDAAGRVIGINTALFIENKGGGKGEGRGVNFAIPINLAKNIVTELSAKGRVIRGWLGVVVGNFAKETATPLTTGGVLVVEVFANSPAAAAGMKAGDFIVGAGNKTFTNSRDLLLFIASFGVDKKLPVAIIREGQPLLLDVLIREKIEKTPLLVPSDKKTSATTERLSPKPFSKGIKQERGKRKNRGSTTSLLTRHQDSAATIIVANS